MTSHWPHSNAKRLCDLVGGTVLLALTGLPQLLIGLLLYLSGHRRPLFRQARPGRAGEAFELVKFRTMTEDTDEAGFLLPDSDRITAVGSFLRSTSLDELPELWNVVKGDMSLVGPRPLLMQYLPLYSQHQARRHECRPGITGLAQVSGRNTLDWSTRLDLDVEYVETASLRLDCAILAKTVWRVFQREGIAAEGHATMEPFSGEGLERGSSWSPT